jgi:hypothetical protein
MMNEFDDSVFGLCWAIRILILLGRALVEFILMSCSLDIFRSASHTRIHALRRSVDSIVTSSLVTHGV